MGGISELGGATIIKVYAIIRSPFADLSIL